MKNPTQQPSHSKGRRRQTFQTFPFSPLGTGKAFSVQIPETILAAMKLSQAEAKRVTGSWKSAVAALEITLKRKEAEETIQLFEPLLNIARRHIPTTPQPNEPLTLANALAPFVLGYAEAKEDALWLLQFEQYRSRLNSPGVAPVLTKAVAQAIRDNDANFFKQLGRRFSNPVSPLQARRSPNPIRNLILFHWIPLDGTTVPLCHFTDEALTEFFKKIVARDAWPSVEAVRTVRKNLRLMRPQKLVVRRVSQTPQGVLLG